MNLDVYADFEHIYMLNFSVDARRLAKLAPAPLRVLQKRGRGLASFVLPSIKRMRPALTRFPALDYEMCGMRILVEHHGADNHTMTGVYFARLIVDPGWVGRIADLLTPLEVEAGSIVKRATGTDGGPVQPEAELDRRRCEIEVRRGRGAVFLRADVRVEPGATPRDLPPGSVFADAEQALETFNDITYGFMPRPGGNEVEILQVTAPHENYVAWPLVPLAVDDVWVQPLHDDALFEGTSITAEPSYFAGRVPRYWRWLQPEHSPEYAAARAPVTGDEPAQ